MTGLWRCIRCGKSFATARAARDHHRDQHAGRLPHEIAPAPVEAPFLVGAMPHDPGMNVSLPDVFPTPKIARSFR